MTSERQGTRAIGRAAVRTELARVAFDCFSDAGFEDVTFDDLAVAAGVSRSTMLRYFGSKEAVVLFVLDPLGDQMAARLASRPGSERQWMGLRRALDPTVELLSEPVQRGLSLLRLVTRTPALCSRLREQQAQWRDGLVAELVRRAGTGDSRRVVLGARAAAALDCLMAAMEEWVATDGSKPLDGLVDLAFSGLNTSTALKARDEQADPSL